MKLKMFLLKQWKKKNLQNSAAADSGTPVLFFLCLKFLTCTPQQNPSRLIIQRFPQYDSQPQSNLLNIQLCQQHRVAWAPEPQPGCISSSPTNRNLVRGPPGTIKLKSHSRHFWWIHIQEKNPVFKRSDPPWCAQTVTPSPKYCSQNTF